MYEQYRAEKNKWAADLATKDAQMQKEATKLTNADEKWHKIETHYKEVIKEANSKIACLESQLQIKDAKDMQGQSIKEKFEPKNMAGEPLSKLQGKNKKQKSNQSKH